MLNFDMNIEFKGRCWDLIRLGIISLDENYIYWFADKFLSLHMSNNYTIRSYKWTTLEGLKIYEEVLECKRLENAVFEELVFNVKKCICNGEYVISILDQSILFPDDFEDEPDAFHDTLTIGYDEQKSFFYIIDPSLGSNIQTIKFDVYEKAFKKAVYKMKTYNFWPYLTGLSPLSTIKPKKIKKRIPDIGFLYNIYFYENYSSCKVEDEKFDHYTVNNEWYGNSIYKGLYTNLLTDLREKRIEMTMKILYSLQYFYESRVSLTKRLYFMAEQYQWKNIDGLYKRIQELVQKWKLIKTLFAKYYYSKEERILNRLEVYLKEAERMDDWVMQSISNLLAKTIEATLY